MIYSVTITRSSDGQVYGPQKFKLASERQAYIDRVINKPVLGNGPEDFTVDMSEDRSDEIKVKYDEMVKDIYDQMLVVFGTNNDVSAQAFAATYEAMAKRPAAYAGSLGLVDEAAVLAYANSKMADADAYAVFRMTRIAQFQAEKEAILNP